MAAIPLERIHDDDSANAAANAARNDVSDPKVRDRLSDLLRVGQNPHAGWSLAERSSGDLIIEVDKTRGRIVYESENEERVRFRITPKDPTTGWL